MTKGIRRQGREFALKIIYSLQDQEEPVETILADFWRNFRFQNDILGDPIDVADGPLPFEVRRFAEELILGVAENLEKIDQVIEEHSTNWALDRMARVDLSLLRLATYEMLFRLETPTSVVINEAIEIGKRFGTKDTPAFINGILDKISRVYRQNP
jgi:transcription antitermination protein NusB